MHGLVSREPRMDGSLLSAGSPVALSRQVAEGGPGDRLRDRDAGAARAGRERNQGDACPPGCSPGKDFLAMGLLCITYARLAEDRAGDGKSRNDLRSRTDKYKQQ